MKRYGTHGSNGSWHTSGSGRAAEKRFVAGEMLHESYDSEYRDQYLQLMGARDWHTPIEDDGVEYGQYVDWLLVHDPDRLEWDERYPDKAALS